MEPEFSWYSLPGDSSLEQGDILFDIPVMVPAEEFVPSEQTPVTFEWRSMTSIVLSQSCDLVPGREKISDVLLAPVWERSEFRGHMATAKGLEEARRGYLPNYHMLNKCDLSGVAFDISIVEFRRLSTLPPPFLQSLVARGHRRVRLLPPYRERSAQAFARFFMRVGLPIDIPPFKS